MDIAVQGRLLKAITTKLRSEGKIVQAVTSCGIVALLLQRGRKAHSRFHIPLILTEEWTCDIKKGSHLPELINKTSLILWDEAPKANKICFEALDKTLRDILRNKNYNNNERPFGSMTMVLGGDFRNIYNGQNRRRGNNISKLRHCMQSDYSKWWYTYAISNRVPKQPNNSWNTKLW